MKHLLTCCLFIAVLSCTKKEDCICAHYEYVQWTDTTYNVLGTSASDMSFTVYKDSNFQECESKEEMLNHEDTLTSTYFYTQKGACHLD